jgi:hypothetical protein
VHTILFNWPPGKNDSLNTGISTAHSLPSAFCQRVSGGDCIGIFGGWKMGFREERSTCLANAVEFVQELVVLALPARGSVLIFLHVRYKVAS